MTREAKQPHVLCSQSIVITLLAHKTCLCILGYIAYICNRGVDASQVNLLKNALHETRKVEKFIFYLSKTNFKKQKA